MTSSKSDMNFDPEARSLLPQNYTSTNTKEKGGGDEEEVVPSFASLIHQKIETSFESITGNSRQEIITQILAVIVATIFTVVTGIPFGAAYFPITWSSTDTNIGLDAGHANLAGHADYSSNTAFPIPGKEAFGLRIYLFSTIMCQLVLTFTSSFTNPIGCQIVENIPFYHVIAAICFEELGYGIEALSNLLLLLALTSILVGVAFYILGALELGRAIYFIPKHVIVGLIGGIGVFIACVGVEVTINQGFQLNLSGFRALVDNFHLFSLVIGFELVLRLLIYWNTLDPKLGTGTARFTQLIPVFYCLIAPMFFLGMWISGMTFQKAQNGGYFFPSVDDGSSTNGTSGNGGGDNDGQSQTIWAEIYAMFTDPHLLDMWRVLDVRHLSGSVLIKSLPTMLGMTLFSLIHVPIYVPALNMSTGQDADINVELIAHGWSNMVTGLFGGLQNYMSYSNSAAYAISGGKGKISSLGITFCTGIFFFIGPAICKYIPRCMAGVILVHLGIDLLKEALVDTFHDFDYLEYFGIWFVTTVIAIYGMENGLVAGVMTALSVFIAQSVHVQHPINGHSSAEMLRSSKWNRSAEAKAILDDTLVGCKRVCIVQLQGHLFFGNLSKLTDSLRNIVMEHELKHGKAWILILDFSLVLGMDASAAMGISKMKDVIHDEYGISLCIYVTGKEREKGFPCVYKLVDDLVGESNQNSVGYGSVDTGTMTATNTISTTIHSKSNSFDSTRHHVHHRMDDTIDIILHENENKKTIAADQICQTLDEALKFAEDALIARNNESLCDPLISEIQIPTIETINSKQTIEDEHFILKKLLRNLLAEEFGRFYVPLIKNLERQVYYKGDIIWESGSASTSTKFVVRGKLMCIQDDGKEILEEIESGQVIGEAALVQNLHRTSKVIGHSAVAVLYSLSRENYETLLRDKPKIAMCIQMIAVRNLAFRSQHVSHNIFGREGRNLPI